MNAVDRRVRELVMAEVRRVHARTTVSVAYCECGHADDEHYGAGGELHCGGRDCDCPRFRLVGYLELA